MKNFKKSLNLYFRTALFPAAIAVGMIILTAVLILASKKPQHIGDKEYIAMVTTIGMGQLGILVALLPTSLILVKNRFHLSSSCAKSLYTIVNAIVPLFLCILYNIVSSLIIGITSGLSEMCGLLIFNSIFGSIVTLSVSLAGKNMIPIAYVPLYLMMIGSTWLDSSGYYGSEFSVPAAVGFAAGIYLLFAVISITLLRLWYKKGNRFCRYISADL